MENYESMDALLKSDANSVREPFLRQVKAPSPPEEHGRLMTEKWKSMVKRSRGVMLLLLIMVTGSVPCLTMPDNSTYTEKLKVFISIYKWGFLVFVLTFIPSSSFATSGVLTALLDMVSLSTGFLTVVFGISEYSVRESVIAGCVIAVYMIPLFWILFPPSANAPPPPEHGRLMTENWKLMAKRSHVVLLPILIMITGAVPYLTMTEDSTFKDKLEVFISIYAWGFLVYVLMFIVSSGSTSVVLTASLDILSILIGFTTIFFGISYYSVRESVIAGCVTACFMITLFWILFPSDPANAPPPPPEQGRLMTQSWKSMAKNSHIVLLPMLIMITGVIPYMTMIDDSTYKKNFDVFISIYGWGFLAYVLAFIASSGSTSVVLTASLDILSILIGFTTFFFGTSYYWGRQSVEAGCVALIVMIVFFSILFPKKQLG